MELNLEKGYIQDAYTRITLDRLLRVDPHGVISIETKNYAGNMQGDQCYLYCQ